MGKNMIIKILRNQLEAASGTVLELNMTVSNLNGTVNELNARIASLEALLQERDASLTKAQNQMRGLYKLTEKKSERQKPQPPAPKTEEERWSRSARRQSGKPAATTEPGAAQSSTPWPVPAD